MRTYAIAAGVSFVVSAVVGCMAWMGTATASVTLFAVSPGLLAFAATSDMLSKPPSYQSIGLFLAMNAIWYLLLALVVRFVFWIGGRLVAMTRAPGAPRAR